MRPEPRRERSIDRLGFHLWSLFACPFAGWMALASLPDGTPAKLGLPVLAAVPALLAVAVGRLTRRPRRELVGGTLAAVLVCAGVWLLLYLPLAAIGSD